MKLLLLTKKFPYPLTEGEPIAINYLARSLAAQGCEVDLLVMNTSKHYFDPQLFPKDENFFNEVHDVRVANHITPAGALASLLRGQSYILDRFKSAAFEQKLTDLLRKKQYDIVQLETIYLAHCLPCIRANSAAKVALRAHNVEHEIWERVAATTPNFLKKWYLKFQNRSLRAFEQERLRQMDALLAITARDLAAFGKLGFDRPAVVAPVGIDLAAYPVENQTVAEGNTACFIGALDWMPNQHGVVWFLENVWPLVLRQCPDARFHIAGKNTPDWLMARSGQSVEVHGQVPDAKSFIRQHGVLVAPLFSGSGIKIKVLEGMALGRTVVTTSIGTEGILAQPGQHVLLADTAAVFAEQLLWCFENRDAAAKIGASARAFIQSDFDNSVIGKRVLDFYDRLIKS